MKNRLIISLCITTFAGSVFITSGKFVNTTNTPKFYFVFACILLITALVAISRKSINFQTIRSKTILWGISVICFLQAGYALVQFVGWFQSNHSKFAITGSFDNPAGFAAVLAIGFPIGLFLLAKAKKVERYLASAFLVLIVIAVFLSDSRTGILAIIISSVVFLLFKTNIMSKFRQLRNYKLLSGLALGLIVGGAFMLYSQKKDSANGRLLIWKVSSYMIKTKPFLGHGYGAFKAKYMNYQAEYFKNNPNSNFELLADNVKHPFNEFIKVAVEFGLNGLIILLSFILFVLHKIMKSKSENRVFALSGLAAFLVLACFSYPLQYVSSWLLLAFYISTLLPSKEIEIKVTPISITTRGVIVIACIFYIVHTFRQIRAEIKWKTIAVSSLRGNTDEMLPEYGKLYSTLLKQTPFFLYNYGAELNVAGRFDQSINILVECQKRFNDYDLQMLLADNYRKKGKYNDAIILYEHASNMIPCRFYPMYQLFKIYRETKDNVQARKIAKEIMIKEVKIPSYSVDFIKEEAKEYVASTIRND